MVRLQHKRHVRLPRIEVVYLFCGIGSLSYGMKSVGFHILAGFDIGHTCEYEYETNIGGEFVFKFIRLHKNEKYEVWCDVVYCLDYGIPQTSTRSVLIASKLGDVEPLIPTFKKEDYTMVRDAIGLLPSLNAGQQGSNDPLHGYSSLSELNLRRIKLTPEGVGWKYWPEILILECHKRESSIKAKVTCDDAIERLYYEIVCTEHKADTYRSTIYNIPIAAEPDSAYGKT